MLQTQPGRLFFPKRTHELSAGESDAPDGRGAEYVAPVARLNSRAMPIGAPDLLAMLLRTMEAEITRARVTEARLIKALGRET